MDHFAGLDVSMAETHICVMDREGVIAHEVKVQTTPEAIAAALAKAPAVVRMVFETGRMAPMLYHGLIELGVPVVCIESRHAYHTLKSLATHKTDRNDARGLAHLARTGFFKPVHVKSLPAHARACADHRAQEAGRPAGHAGEPDSRSGGGVRRPAAPRAQPCLHRAGSSGKRGHRRAVRRHAGARCGTGRRAAAPSSPSTEI